MDKFDDRALLERRLLPKHFRPRVKPVQRLQPHPQLPPDIVDVLREIDGRLGSIRDHDAETVRRLDALHDEIRELRAEIAKEDSGWLSILLPAGVLVLLLAVLIGPSLPLPFTSSAPAQQALYPTSMPAAPLVAASPTIQPTVQPTPRPTHVARHALKTRHQPKKQK